MKPDLKLEGGKELERALMDLAEPRFMRQAIYASIRRGANVILRAIRARIPVRTGALKRDLKVRRYKSRIPTLQISFTGGKGEMLSGGIYNKQGLAYIARFIELGTSKMPAKPFFRPGLDENKQASLDELGRSLGEQIEKRAQKVGKK